ncbi:unnamed protein product [Pleuronectes platessa]|uniref:Uncharacterized protein n=1 Tax=Pleuronectes platessa TaxID=8262 RepID=A0A9N7YGZ9_PLEPL|nr:unnamed protein product [Pleuronectes platessa]
MRGTRRGQQAGGRAGSVLVGGSTLIRGTVANSAQPLILRSPFHRSSSSELRLLPHSSASYFSSWSRMRREQEGRQRRKTKKEGAKERRIERVRERERVSERGTATALKVRFDVWHPREHPEEWE